MNVLVILPVYNEAENISQIVKKILSIDRGLKILIIDDNSTDSSLQISVQLARENPLQVFYLHRHGLRGRGLSTIEGYKFAVSRGFDYVIEMDADLSHNPEYIPQFLKEIKRADIVIGSRYVRGGAIKGRSLYRNIISYLANIYLRYLLGLRDIKDFTSGYRCIKTDFLRKVDLDSLRSRGPELLQELIFKNKSHLNIKEIPIVFEERRYGRSKFSLFTIMRSLIAPISWKK
ncbi:MAG: polyprenol monophosphomannose synthase [Candidatus Omnitrophica bacterium]|nr:polyprenol monophosphomannose synthase [Candidatus Omnitrophota bacterium]